MRHDGQEREAAHEDELAALRERCAEYEEQLAAERQKGQVRAWAASST